MNVPGLPDNAPHWAYGIYWIIIAIGAAMVILVPLLVKAYADVHTHMLRIRESTAKLQRSADAAAVNSAIVSRKVDSLSSSPVAPPNVEPVVPVDTTEQDVLNAASQLKAMKGSTQDGVQS